TITGVDYLFQPSPDPEATELPFSVTVSTAFFGDITQMNTMKLVKEGEGSQERWRILWSPSLIFRELTGASLVHFFTDVPQRGAIYDRNGAPLALDGQVHVVGIVPGLIKDREALISALAERLEMTEERIQQEVEADVPSYYFIPLKTLPYGTPEEIIQSFYAMQSEGVVVRPALQRAYPQGSLAGHTLGYLMEVSE
ncbi:MAG: hypothetical protein GWN58_53400, partial [Anaerolineae bacterium]|nr:hypothetical protein [Thermoplasmata archaeon]NIV37909.1 hypothetical protein [Anaerolineae bacterium]